MGLFTSVDRRRVVEFFSDDTFQILDLTTHDGSVVKKDDKGLKEGWPVINKLQIPFNGKEFGMRKNERIMIISENDIIEDPFNILSPEEKPTAGPTLVKDYVKQKAESVVYRHQAKPQKADTMNKVVIFLGVGIVGLVVMALINILRS